jgi:hypothetical protein
VNAGGSIITHGFFLICHRLYLILILYGVVRILDKQMALSPALTGAANSGPSVTGAASVPSLDDLLQLTLRQVLADGRRADRQARRQDEVKEIKHVIVVPPSPALAAASVSGKRLSGGPPSAGLPSLARAGLVRASSSSSGGAGGGGGGGGSGVAVAPPLSKQQRREAQARAMLAELADEQDGPQREMQALRNELRQIRKAQFDEVAKAKSLANRAATEAKAAQQETDMRTFATLRDSTFTGVGRGADGSIRFNFQNGGSIHSPPGVGVSSVETVRVGQGERSQLQTVFRPAFRSRDCPIVQQINECIQSGQRLVLTSCGPVNMNINERAGLTQRVQVLKFRATAGPDPNNGGDSVRQSAIQRIAKKIRHKDVRKPLIFYRELMFVTGDGTTDSPWTFVL